MEREKGFASVKLRIAFLTRIAPVHGPRSGMHGAMAWERVNASPARSNFDRLSLDPPTYIAASYSTIHTVQDHTASIVATYSLAYKQTTESWLERVRPVAWHAYKPADWSSIHLHHATSNMLSLPSPSPQAYLNAAVLCLGAAATCEPMFPHLQTRQTHTRVLFGPTTTRAAALATERLRLQLYRAGKEKSICKACKWPDQPSKHHVQPSCPVTLALPLRSTALNLPTVWLCIIQT